MKYLKSINLDRLPSNIILVNEDYPMDCTMYPSLLDPGQHRYSIRGQITEAQVQENLFQEPAQSPQSLKVKSGRPPKSSDVHIEQTPPRSTSGTQVGEPEENLPLLVPAELCTDGQGSVTQEVPTFVRQNDDLDEMISVALKIQHLPLDDDDDDDADRLASPDDQGDPRYSDEEEHGNPHAKKIRQKPGKRGNFHQDGFSCMKGGTGVILSSNPNKQTISILEEMSEYYSRTRDEWRTRAYRQAIGTLKKQTRKIATYDDALALPMIGHRLATKIEEIALTNRLRRLDNTKLDPSDQSLQIFTKVYNAGFQVAFRWVQAGYKSLDDLMAHANLTARQRIGIEHYDDFNTRIPRDEVTALGDIVKKAAARINPSVTVMIMGSYRRGAATSGDIDLMLTKPGSTSSQDLLPFLSTLIDQLTRDGFLVCALAEPRGDGGSKWHGACVLPGHNTIWRRIDFLLVPETQMGAALIYFTGDDIFNRSIRLLSSKKGMRLNQEGLFKDVMRGPGRVKLNEGTLVEGADEKKIFEILGVPWRPPEQRILH
jgi:DNA polymerase IV